METKDTLSSCSDLDEQEIQQLQKHAKVLKENSLNKLNALQTTIQHLSSSNYSMYYEFRDAFHRLFEADERTFKTVLSQNMQNLERQLNEETLHKKDSNSDLRVIKVQFDQFIHSKVLEPSNYNSYDLETRKNFKDYTQMEAQTFKETIIQNMNSIEQCIVERASHEQKLQNSRIVSYNGNVQGIETQSNTSGDESSSLRNECNDKSTSGDVTDISPTYDIELMVEVPYIAEYNVFAVDTQHSEQPESISNTCVVETGDSNVIPDSPNMCDNDIQNDQNDVECDDKRVELANLIANLKLDVDENKKIQKQLKKANTTLDQELNECKSILAETSRTLGESNSIWDSLVALQNKQTEFERYKNLNDRTVDYEKLEHKLNETLGLLAQKDIDIKEGLKLKAYEISVLKEKHDELVKQRLLTKSHYEGLVKEKTQNDSLTFVHELKQEMHVDLKYVESLKNEIDKLESDKAEFSNMFDMLLQQCVSNELSKQTETVSKEVYNKLLQSFAKLEKHSISLELALQQFQEQMKNDTVCKEKASTVFLKEHEQYFEIQDLKAQLQDKDIAISELKKLIEKMKGKSVDTNFEKQSILGKPPSQPIRNQLVWMLFSTYKAYNGGNVIFDSNLHGNIIGKGQICDSKCKVIFSENDIEIVKGGKVIESLNVTFDETPPPSKTSPLVDYDLDEEEEEAIKVTKKKNLENDIKDETLEIDEIVNIKESRNNPLENVIGNLNQRTLRLESIRISLAYACALDFKLFQMDVKSAFLNGFINEEVYVAQPLGFIDFEKPDHVYKLKKAVYDLKQAPKACVPRSGPYQTNPPCPDELISYVQEEREGMITRGYRDHVPACLCFMLYCVAKSEKFNLTFFIAKRMELIRKDHDMRRGHPSISSSFTFGQLSSSHLNDNNDDDDGNNKGTSHTNTTSPTRVVKSLTNEVPQIFENPPDINPDLEPLYTCQTEILNHQVQLQNEHRGGLRSIGKGIRNLLRKKKK
ncbi:integrase, catalytic region, zinc finger, CCHC-type containing protein [Tanacetum coccineum]